MKILNNILEAIGNTPIVKLNRVGVDLDCNMLVKCEFFNSGGSLKDRIAKHMIEKAEAEGKIKPGDTLMDFGCAKGFLTHAFRLLQVDAWGVDISDYAIKNCLFEVKKYLQVGNAKKLPFPDNSFDVVISINTVHNLESKECSKALSEINRVSKNFSYVIVDAYGNELEKNRC